MKLYEIHERFINGGYETRTFIYTQKALYRQLVMFYGYQKSFSYLSKRLARASHFSYCNSYARVNIEEVPQ